MKKDHLVHHLSDASTACLSCACENRYNFSARHLLMKTEALSSVGVIAAVLIDESVEHLELLKLARKAIREQREWCEENGPFRPSRCNVARRA
ncbi:MAG TPA: hypothetical protein VFM36_11920 [Thermoanaerobaculia bacterium]|nr:hypothetical protein [Thermoanaerobaculia bacterium]